MSSISPHPDGASGTTPGGGDGNPDHAEAPQGGFGPGASANPAGYPPGTMSSGSAAFASPLPSAAPGITPTPNSPAPGGQVPPPPPHGPAAGAPAPNPGYGAPQGHGPASYQAPAPQNPAPYGGPPQPHQAPQPGQGGPYGQQPQGQPYGQPQPGQSPQQPVPYGQDPQQQGQQPNPYGQGPQSGYYGQPPQSPQTAPPPPQMPQAPYASRPEPGREMPTAGASPIRRNLDDTAELPAFLDSARSDEGPDTESGPTAVKPLKRKFPLTTGFTALLRHRHALSVLVRRDLAVKYQATFMGYVWSLIEPLGLAMIYWFVFDIVFSSGKAMPEGADNVGYPLFIVSGIFAYQWFSSAVNEGTKSLGGQSSLITVMKVPREVFPISKAFARFAEYVVGFPILLIMAISFGGTFGFNLFWLIPAILVEVMLITGMVFILAAANVLFKDVQRFLGLFMRVLFYSSAIIYPITKVAEAQMMQDNPWLFDLYSLNPLIGIFNMHRAVFIPEFAPTWFQIGASVGFATFLLFFGRWIFYKLEPRVLKAL